MKLPRLMHWILVVLLPAVVMGIASTRAMAQADPPGRVGRLNLTEGPVTFAPAGDNEWTEAELNRPLTRGDKLWTDKGSRAEIQIGSSAVRMDGQTQVEVLALDDQSTQLSLTKGTVYVRVRSLPEGENFEIDTPNLAYRAAYPGDYRIDVDAVRGTTRVTIHSGTGAVYGEKGQVQPLGGGQQVMFKARALAQVTAQESPPQDNFDRWAAERNRREDQSVSARFVPREVVGYQHLDSHGQWTHDATHGAVWTPAGTAATWAPYRNGRWEWVVPWGWTWMDDAPWGFATSHYGRWTQVNNKWAWVPGRIGLRPIYAPALVAFIGTGKPGVAWFPLAPGEAWQPGYRTTPLYISNVNRNMPPATTSYAFQNKPEALTALSVEDFHRGKPVKGSWMKVAGNMLASAQIVPPPPMPERAARSMMARGATPATADIRQVTNPMPSAQQQAEAQRQAKAALEVERAQREQAQRAEQARLAEQVKAAEQARIAEQARLAAQAKAAEKAAEQARAAEQQKLAQQAKATEQARVAEQKAAEQLRLAQQARIAEQQKAAELAKAEQARLADQQARAAAQAKTVAAQQARAARQVEQARSQEQARVAEQARLAEQMQRAAQAKLAQQGKRTDVAKRDTAARKAEQAKREVAALREQAARDQVAKRESSKRESQAKREKLVREQQIIAARAQARAEQQEAQRAEQAKRVAAAKREEQARRAAHAQQVELARRAADREAQVLRDQRAQREAAAARKQAEEREQAQREAWQRHQQALSEQWRRDQSAWEQQQRERAARPQRPDLRRSAPPQEPEVWQRGIPILNPGRTS